MCVNRKMRQYLKQPFSRFSTNLLLTVDVVYIGYARFICGKILDFKNKMTDPITIDDDILSVWSKFPASIRNDPCFSAFREEFEGANGKIHLIRLPDSIEISPKIVALFT